jgi:hypothetical protein
MCCLAIWGCSNSTRISHSYVSPEIGALDLQGVLVVAVARQPSSRRHFEDAFAKALRRQGIDAVASHTLVARHQAPAEDMIAAAEANGLDTILVTRYIGEKTEEVYHPGTIYYGLTPAYDPGYYGGFGGYYARAYEVAYQQPVWTANVTHTLISDLYSAATRAHLWQAVTDTIQSSGTRQVSDDAIDALIADLKKQGLID